MAKRGVKHNRLLLTYWMIRGGLNPLEAWRESGKKIKRSLAQLNRKKSDAEITEEFVREGI